MVIQPAEAVLPAGGEGELQPYVICIDADRAGPSVGSSYALGVMAAGDLLKLAECICQEDLTAMEESMDFDSIFGLQMAVWQVSGGVPDFQSMFDQVSEEGGALGGLVGEELGDLGMDLQQLADLMDELFGASVQEWLDKCDIQPQS